MAKEWYRNVEGTPTGPVSSMELQQLAQNGQLGPDDLICPVGGSSWMPAAKIKGLSFVSASDTNQPTADTVPPFVPPVKPESTSKRQRSAWLIPSITAGVFCLLTISITAAVLLSNNTNSSQVTKSSSKDGANSESENAVDQRVEKLHEELEKERSKLRKQIQELEERKDDIEKENRNLQEQQEKLDREIQNLVSKLNYLKEWKQADFILASPPQLSVAIKDDGKRLQVISEGEGELAKLALRACRNWHIPRMIDDATLTRNVIQQVDRGEPIPQALEATIRNEFWKPQRFVPVSYEAKSNELELIVFRDLETYDFRLGYCLGTDKDGLEFYPLGTKLERVTWSDIQPGSARKAPALDILRTIGDVDFLEYCVLRISQKLGSVEKNGALLPSARPSVFVHVDLDIPDDHIKFYQSLDRQLQDQGRPLEQFEARGALGIMAFLIDLGVRTSVPARRKALRQEMLQTDPHLRVRHLSRYVEDEIKARLSQCGIAPISKKDRDLLASSEIQDVLKATSFHDATHLLAVTVKNARGSGDYHLSMRLYREDGKEVWTDEGDRILNTDGIGNQYHVVSGHPAIVYLKPDAFSEFHGVESPPVIPGIKKRSIAEKFSHLVFLESQPDSPVVQHRTLFQTNTFNTPREQIESIRPIKTIEDVPQEHILRYVTTRIAHAVLPAAGLVKQINSQAAIASIGKRDGVNSGDRLRVIRTRRAPRSLAEVGSPRDRSYGLFAYGDSYLPTELTVIQAADHQCTLAVSSTGLETEWPENVSLQENDLVLVRANSTRAVYVESPVIVPPSPHVTSRLRLNTNPLVRQKYELNAKQTAAQVSELIESALGNLQVPVISTPARPASRSRFSRKREAAVTDSQATHRVYGTITLSPKINVAARAAARPHYRLELKVSSVKSNEIIEQFDFDLKDFVRPSK